jgi:hypothetical protein
MSDPGLSRSSARSWLEARLKLLASGDHRGARAGLGDFARVADTGELSPDQQRRVQMMIHLARVALSDPTDLDTARFALGVALRSLGNGSAPASGGSQASVIG